MAVGAKAAAFAALLRIFPGVFAGPGVGEQWHHILLWMAMLTMTVGNVVALSQDSVKRMLAYSSIAHAGYLLIGVLAAGSALRNASGPGAEKATAAVLVYLAIYAVMNLGAFAVLVYLENSHAANGDDVDSEDANISMDGLRGLAWRQPVAAAALTIFLLSLAGIPPTAGFFGKLYIFMEAINQGLIGLVIVGVLNTVISVYYYLRPVVSMYMQGEGESETVVAVAGDGTAAARAVSGLSGATVLAIAVCVVAVLGMVVLQDLLMTWAQGAARLMPSL
jgi:NADH-quinone oxidoreductase subunit N